MHKSNKLALLDLFHLCIDAIGLIISYLIAYLVASNFTELYGVGNYAWIMFIYIPLWIFLMSINGMYNNTTFNYYDRIFRNILASTIFSSVLVAALMYAIKNSMFSRTLFISYIIITFVFMLFLRYVSSYIAKYYSRESVKQVMVVGEDEMYEKFKKFILKTNVQMNVERYVSIKDEKDLFSLEELEKRLIKDVIDEVYFILPIKYFKQIQEYALLCEEMGISSRILLDIVDMKFSKIHVASIGTFPMVTFHSISMNSLQLSIKRVMDIFGGMVGLLLTSIFFIVTAISIKVESPGPVFFIQKRVGKNGRIFDLYKFRSMCIDAEEKKKQMSEDNVMGDGRMFKVKNDPRITKVGKFIRKTSIDELPQFLNVIKGDMSLVGTRPPTVDEVDKYKNNHRRRISIKPGITGLWQVSGRNQITDFDEVVELDTKYIDEWSVWLDIKIMIKTIMVVFGKRGAY